MFRKSLFAVLLVFAVLAAPRPSQAADLKIEFSELASLVNSIFSDAKIRLHNAPGGFLGLFDMGGGSYVSLGGSQIAIEDVQAQRFRAGGANYVIYINDINSVTVTARAVTGAMRLTLAFETDDLELVATCESGFFCPSNDSLPSVEWRNPIVDIDLIPVRVGNSMALSVKRVDVKGQLVPVCRSGITFINRAICRSAILAARPSIARARSQVATTLKDKMNEPGIRNLMADALSPYLALGPVGQVKIRQILVNSRSTTIRFCLACANGG